MKRSHGRTTDALRPVTIEPQFYEYADGSCLIAFGGTQVICAATIENTVPPHLRGSGKGWVTAEYSMLPKSSPDRIRREREKIGGRTHEIQRLIGRSLRCITTMEGWGERTIMIDCDVLRADGGTRTASITGAFIALVQAFRKMKKNGMVSQNLTFPVQDYLSAISVGIVQGEPCLDLDYPEDSTADTDMNIVLTGMGKIVEIQGTAEKQAFSKEEFSRLLALGEQGCQSLHGIQRQILGPLGW
jgi:ribonuclease PH